MPSEFPRSSAEQPLTAYGVLRSAREIGGDLYDCFWIAPEQLCLIVADVSDKGEQGAFFGEERLEAALQSCANEEPQDLVNAVLGLLLALQPPLTISQSLYAAGARDYVRNHNQ